MWVLLLIVLIIVFLFIVIKERNNLPSFSSQSYEKSQNKLLKDCPNCQNAVSKKAETCPYCKQQLKFQITKSQAFIIGLALLIIAIWATDSPENSKYHEQNEALNACENYITPTLKNPSSADFDKANAKVLEPKPDFKTIFLTVRATNSYNAVVSTNYACFVKNINGEWIVQELQEINK